jgi:hypothetical protein
MAFRDGINGFIRRVEARHRSVFVGVCTAVHDSIVNGSAVTGAPGQPVDSGNLKASWVPEFVDANTFQTTTNVEYAPIIEHNLRGATLRSSVGGFHSVALTVAGFDRIVASEVAKASGG